MSGGSGRGPAQRRAFFDDDRLAAPDSGAGLLPVLGAADARVQALRRFRELRSEAAAGGGGGAAGLAAVPGQLNWIPIGPNAVLRGQGSGLPVVSGRCQDLGVSSDGLRIYAGTANGGVWRSLDGGDSWNPMSDEFDQDPVGQQVDSLSTGALGFVEGADAEHDRLYVGTGEGFAGVGAGRPTDFLGVGMLLSTNGGRTWVQEASAPSLLGFGVYEIAVDPTNPEVALAATSRGLYRRLNAAGGWVREAVGALGVGTAFTSVVAATRGGSTRFYTVGGGIVHEGTAAAGGWNVVAVYPGGVGRASLAASASDPPTIYALAANGRQFNGIHRVAMTLPAAGAWSTVAGTPPVFGRPGHEQGDYDQAIVVDPSDPNRLYIGGSGQSISGEFSANIFRLAVSPDGSGGFTCSSDLIGGGSHADVHALKFRPGSSRELWGGCDGGVYRARDATASGNSQFESRNIGLATLTLMGLGHHPTEESYAFCGAQDNGGLRYLGDEVWDHQLPGDGGDTIVDWNTGARIVNGYVNGDVRRADIDGSRYSDTDISPPLGGEAVLFYPPIAGVAPTGNPADAGLIAFGAESPFVSANFGGSWVKLPHRVGAAGVQLRALCFAGNSRLYAGWTDGHVARYDLLVAGWTRTDIPPPGEFRPITSIAIDPADATGSSAFVTLAGAPGVGNRVRHVNSAPVAAVWTAPAVGLLDVVHNAIVIDPANPNRRWVAADLGVWAWNNAAASLSLIHI